MSGAAKATMDHAEIREWAEEKGATPAIVKGTGILRLDVPGFSGNSTFNKLVHRGRVDRKNARAPGASGE